MGHQGSGSGSGAASGIVAFGWKGYGWHGGLECGVGCDGDGKTCGDVCVCVGKRD